MSEQQDKESSDGAAKPSSTATGPTVTRFRSRFPKAMPNLAPRNPTATSTPSSATPTEEKAVEVAPIQETPSSDVSKTVETTSTDQASSITISTPESPKKQVSINADSAQQSGARVRSRFPRAQPNLALSSGLERMRRLSGHYHAGGEHHQPSPLASGSSTSLVDSTTTHLRTPPQTPQPHLDQLLASPRDPHSSRQNSVSSPMKQRTLSMSDPLSSSLAHSPGGMVSSIRQAFAASPLAQSLGASSLIISQPATPYTPLHSVYSSKFPKEQIKNFIKHIAMQKLKKFEAESLKEKRKTYKKKAEGSKSSKQQSSEEATLAAESAPSPSAVDRSKLCMRDFLYYSPRVKKNEEIVMDLSQPGTPASQNPETLMLDETSNHSNVTTSTSSSVSSARTNESISSRPPGEQSEKRVTFAPQLKIAEDGSIIINEESLVVQRENIEPDRTYDTVVETEPSDSLTYNSYRKHHHTRKWTERETTKFYKALSMIGTDFTMIQKLFPNRSRDEIKRKFKREEKLNQALIDKILSKTDQIELSVFVSSSEDESASVAGSNQSESGATSKRKKLKEKNENDKSQEESKNEKKSKLKRIRKRQFVESSDSEDGSESKKVIKSKEFINDSDDNTKSSTIQSTPAETAPAFQISTTLTFAESSPVREKLPPISSLYQTSIIPIREDINIVRESSSSLTVIQEENEKIDDDEEDEEELVLDLDTNSIRLVNESKTSLRGGGGDEDDHVIFDLDNNTLIKQQSNKPTDQTGNSSISISKNSIHPDT